jgi:integrase
MMQKTKYPGVWRLPSGGYHVRTSAIDPRTGRLLPRKRNLPTATLAEAIQEVARLRQIAKDGGTVRDPRRPTLTAFAQSWLETHLPRMTSDLAKARYTEALDLHVLPDLGAIFVDQIRHHDLEAWLVKPRKDRHGGKYSPHTVNGWWRVLKMVLQAAARKHYLPDPTAGVKPLPLPQREHENSLTPEELRSFLNTAKRLYPQWHTFIVLGFTLGMRPGELRPLRWDEDVDLDAGTITIRRSQRRSYVGPTKTKRVRIISIPAALVSLLRAHRDVMKGSAGFGQLGFPAAGGPGVAVGSKKLQEFASLIGLPPRKVRALRWDADIDLAAGVVRRPGNEALRLSPEAVEVFQKRRDGMTGFAHAGDLLFPSEKRGFVTPSCLDKPFRKIAAAAKIRKPITPRAMRRTAQDLSRLAGVNDLVTRAVSGHSDIAMQELYSTIRGEEMRKSLAAVVKLAGLST